MARRPVTSKKPIIGLSLLAILGNQYERPRASTCGRLFVTYSGIISNFNPMKKITIGILFGLLIIPQITLAAWWNPFTWKIFNRPPKVEEVQKTEDVIKMTRKEFKTRFGFYPGEEPVKQEENKTKDVVRSKPKPVTSSPVVNSNYSTDINLWIEAVNSRITSYQKYSTILTSAIERDQGYVRKLQSYPVDEYVYNFIFASSLNYKVQFEEIVKKLNTKIGELNIAVNTIKTDGKVDTIAWNQKLKDFDSYLRVSLGSAIEHKMKHEADLAEANDYIKLLLSESSSGSSSSYSQNSTTTQFNSEVNEYNNKLSDMKKQLVEEYTAAGGYWTASQLEANAMQRLKEMGIKPPTSLSGKLDIGSYSSTKCNSLNGGLDCYGSSGARTQVIPMGNGQFEIRGW